MLFVILSPKRFNGDALLHFFRFLRLTAYVALKTNRRVIASLKSTTFETAMVTSEKNSRARWLERSLILNSYNLLISPQGLPR